MTALFKKHMHPYLLSCLVLLIALGPRQAVAQTEESDQQSTLLWIFSRSRTEVSPSYMYFSDGGTQEAAVEIARTVPMGISRSSLSLQSRISLVHAAVGTRTRPADDNAVRWRAGLLQGDLYRAPVAAGLTILDYSRMGRFDFEARWFEFRVGPAVRWSNERAALEARLVGSAAGTSMRPGSLNYNGLSDAADATYAGVDAGYRAELAGRLNYWLTVSISAGQRILVDRDNLTINGAQTELQVIPWSHVQLFARFRLERLHTGPNSASGRYFRSGVRVSL